MIARSLFVHGLLLISAFTCVVAQEIKPKFEDPPRVGTAMLFELVGKLAQDAKPAWSVEGPAKIDGSNTERSVRIIPTSPGRLVVICKVRTSEGETPKTLNIEVPGSQIPAPAPAPAPAAAQDQAQKQPQHGPDNITALGFTAAGFMGDAESGGVDLQEGNQDQPLHSSGSIRLAYQPGRVGWAAIGWQYVTEGTMNWGESPGLDLNGRGFRSLRIWARGIRTAEGNLPTVQFKSGGGTTPKAQYKATYSVVDEFRPLTERWHEYCLDLSNKDLKMVVSPFTIVTKRAMNPTGVVVYLDEIHFSSQPCGQ